MSAPPNIIGFTGRKRSGKDTAGAALVELGYTRLSFAGPLKAMVGSLLRVQGVGEDAILDMTEGSAKETPSVFLSGRSPRHVMQTLGTEWGRTHVAEDFWVDCLMRAAAQHARVVVTDVRFPNEVAAVHTMGGKVFRISRPSLNAVTDAHASEAQINTLPVYGEIINDAASAEMFKGRIKANFTRYSQTEDERHRLRLSFDQGLLSFDDFAKQMLHGGGA